MTKKIIFSSNVYEEIPVYYRFMVEEKTGDLYELKQEESVCYSKPHRSSGFLTGPSEKPISNLDYQSILDVK